jgi:hypothetical protein
MDFDLDDINSIADEPFFSAGLGKAIAKDVLIGVAITAASWGTLIAFGAGLSWAQKRKAAKENNIDPKPIKNPAN